MELKADRPRPDVIVVVLDDGEERTLEVEYEWLPMLCAKCGLFGHRCKVIEPPAVAVTSAAAVADSQVSARPEVAAEVGVLTRPPAAADDAEVSVRHGINGEGQSFAQNECEEHVPADVPQFEAQNEDNQTESWSTVRRRRKHKGSMVDLPQKGPTIIDALADQLQHSAVDPGIPRLQRKGTKHHSQRGDPETSSPKKLLVVQSLQDPESSREPSAADSSDAVSSEDQISNIGSDEGPPSPVPLAPNRRPFRGMPPRPSHSGFNPQQQIAPGPSRCRSVPPHRDDVADLPAGFLSTSRKRGGARNW